ncbi:hypothetical protein PCE1_000312 [Barthelona sp. PCE]
MDSVYSAAIFSSLAQNPDFDAVQSFVDVWVSRADDFFTDVASTIKGDENASDDAYHILLQVSLEIALHNTEEYVYRHFMFEKMLKLFADCDRKTIFFSFLVEILTSEIFIEKFSINNVKSFLKIYLLSFLDGSNSENVVFDQDSIIKFLKLLKTLKFSMLALDFLNAVLKNNSSLLNNYEFFHMLLTEFDTSRFNIFLLFPTFNNNEVAWESSEIDEILLELLNRSLFPFSNELLKVFKKRQIVYHKVFQNFLEIIELSNLHFLALIHLLYISVSSNEIDNNEALFEYFANIFTNMRSNILETLLSQVDIRCIAEVYVVPILRSGNFHRNKHKTIFFEFFHNCLYLIDITCFFPTSHCVFDCLLSVFDITNNEELVVFESILNQRSIENWSIIEVYNYMLFMFQCISSKNNSFNNFFLDFLDFLNNSPEIILKISNLEPFESIKDITSIFSCDLLNSHLLKCLLLISNHKASSTLCQHIWKLYEVEIISHSDIVKLFNDSTCQVNSISEYYTRCSNTLFYQNFPAHETYEATVFRCVVRFNPFMSDTIELFMQFNAKLELSLLMSKNEFSVQVDGREYVSENISLTPGLVQIGLILNITKKMVTMISDRFDKEICFHLPLSPFDFFNVRSQSEIFYHSTSYLLGNGKNSSFSSLLFSVNNFSHKTTGLIDGNGCLVCQQEISEKNSLSCNVIDQFKTHVPNSRFHLSRFCHNEYNIFFIRRMMKVLWENVNDDRLCVNKDLHVLACFMQVSTFRSFILSFGNGLNLIGSCIKLILVCENPTHEEYESLVSMIGLRDKRQLILNDYFDLLIHNFSFFQKNFHSFLVDFFSRLTENIKHNKVNLHMLRELNAFHHFTLHFFFTDLCLSMELAEKVSMFLTAMAYNCDDVALQRFFFEILADTRSFPKAGVKISPGYIYFKRQTIKILCKSLLLSNRLLITSGEKDFSRMINTLYFNLNYEKHLMNEILMILLIIRQNKEFNLHFQKNGHNVFYILNKSELFFNNQDITFTLLYAFFFLEKHQWLPLIDFHSSISPNEFELQYDDILVSSICNHSSSSYGFRKPFFKGFLRATKSLFKQSLRLSELNMSFLNNTFCSVCVLAFEFQYTVSILFVKEKLGYNINKTGVQLSIIDFFDFDLLKDMIYSYILLSINVQEHPKSTLLKDIVDFFSSFLITLFNTLFFSNVFNFVQIFKRLNNYLQHKIDGIHPLDNQCYALINYQSFLISFASSLVNNVDFRVLVLHADSLLLVFGCLLESFYFTNKFSTVEDYHTLKTSFVHTNSLQERFFETLQLLFTLFNLFNEKTMNFTNSSNTFCFSSNNGNVTILELILYENVDHIAQNTGFDPVYNIKSLNQKKNFRKNFLTLFNEFISVIFCGFLNGMHITPVNLNFVKNMKNKLRFFVSSFFSLPRFLLFTLENHGFFDLLFNEDSITFILFFLALEKYCSFIIFSVLFNNDRLMLYQEVMTRKLTTMGYSFDDIFNSSEKDENLREFADKYNSILSEMNNSDNSMLLNINQVWNWYKEFMTSHREFYNATIRLFFDRETRSALSEQIDKYDLNSLFIFCQDTFQHINVKQESFDFLPQSLLHFRFGKHFSFTDAVSDSHARVQPSVYRDLKDSIVLPTAIFNEFMNVFTDTDIKLRFLTESIYSARFDSHTYDSDAVVVKLLSTYALGGSFKQRAKHKLTHVSLPHQKRNVSVFTASDIVEFELRLRRYTFDSFIHIYFKESLNLSKYTETNKKCFSVLSPNVTIYDISSFTDLYPLRKMQLKEFPNAFTGYRVYFKSCYDSIISSTVIHYVPVDSTTNDNDFMLKTVLSENKSPLLDFYFRGATFIYCKDMQQIFLPDIPHHHNICYDQGQIYGVFGCNHTLLIYNISVNELIFSQDLCDVLNTSSGDLVMVTVSECHNQYFFCILAINHHRSVVIVIDTVNGGFCRLDIDEDVGVNFRKAVVLSSSDNMIRLGFFTTDDNGFIVICDFFELNCELKMVYTLNLHKCRNTNKLLFFSFFVCDTSNDFSHQLIVEPDVDYPDKQFQYKAIAC